MAAPALHKLLSRDRSPPAELSPPRTLPNKTELTRFYGRPKKGNLRRSRAGPLAWRSIKHLHPRACKPSTPRHPQRPSPHSGPRKPACIVPLRSPASAHSCLVLCPDLALTIDVGPECPSSQTFLSRSGGCFSHYESMTHESPDSNTTRETTAIRITVSAPHSEEHRS